MCSRNYAILYPHQCEYKFGRNMRCSPLYSVLETRGAVFGIKMAYERALYFDSTYNSMYFVDYARVSLIFFLGPILNASNNCRYVACINLLVALVV